MAERVTTVGQSFFHPLPAGADLYLLRGVLNDRPDPEATAILHRCAEEARPGGRVVILKHTGAGDTPRALPDFGAILLYGALHCAGGRGSGYSSRCVP